MSAIVVSGAGRAVTDQRITLARTRTDNAHSAPSTCDDRIRHRHRVWWPARRAYPRQDRHSAFAPNTGYVRIIPVWGRISPDRVVLSALAYQRPVFPPVLVGVLSWIRSVCRPVFADGPRRCHEAKPAIVRRITAKRRPGREPLNCPPLQPFGCKPEHGSGCDRIEETGMRPAAIDGLRAPPDGPVPGRAVFPRRCRWHRPMRAGVSRWAPGQSRP